MAANKLTIDKPWKFPSRITTAGMHFDKRSQRVAPRLPRAVKAPDGLIDSLPRLVRRSGYQLPKKKEVA